MLSPGREVGGPGPLHFGKLEEPCQLVGPRKKNEGGMERDRNKRKLRKGGEQRKQAERTEKRLA